MALMIGQQQEDEVRFKLCERCGKLMLIYERCECYNELLRVRIGIKNSPNETESGKPIEYHTREIEIALN